MKGCQCLKILDNFNFLVAVPNAQLPTSDLRLLTSCLLQNKKVSYPLKDSPPFVVYAVLMRSFNNTLSNHLVVIEHPECVHAVTETAEINPDIGARISIIRPLVYHLAR